MPQKMIQPNDRILMIATYSLIFTPSARSWLLSQESSSAELAATARWAADDGGADSDADEQDNEESNMDPSVSIWDEPFGEDFVDDENSDRTLDPDEYEYEQEQEVRARSLRRFRESVYGFREFPQCRERALIVYLCARACYLTFRGLCGLSCAIERLLPINRRRCERVCKAEYNKLRPPRPPRRTRFPVAVWLLPPVTTEKPNP